MDKGGEGRYAPRRANIPATEPANAEVLLRPNAPVNHDSVLHIIEHATKYFINMTKNMQTQYIKAIYPSGQVIKDFNIHITHSMDYTL
jgi:hypothetical protein